MSLQLYYIPCNDLQEAESIAKSLLMCELIACANILSGAHSLYRWQDELHHKTEVILIAKAPAAHFRTIEAHVKSLHSYECPCLLAFDVAQGHLPFIDWALGQTALPDVAK